MPVLQDELLGARWRKVTQCDDPNDLGLEAENAYAFSPERGKQDTTLRPSHAFL